MYLEKDVPCWYELSWDKTRRNLLIRVHKVIMKVGKGFFGNPLNGYKVTFPHFTEFEGKWDKPFWGFNRSFKRIGMRGDFIEFAAQIPQVRKFTGKFCACRGKKKFCIECDGSGKIKEIDDRRVYALSATFSQFFIAVGCEMKTSSKFPQLFTVESITGYGQGFGYGCAVSGLFC